MKKTLICIISAVTALPVLADNVYRDTLGFVSGSATSPAAMLRGQIAGVQVSSYDGSECGALSVNVRGVSSLRSDSQPLYVVDGVQLNAVQTRNLSAYWQDIYEDRSYTTALNGLAFLNPYDIESIEVLKDMSATAAYGARGANGVVLIKTRRAGSGRPELKINSNFGWSPELKGLSHNHHVAVSRRTGQSDYYLAGSFRRLSGTESGRGSNYGSLKAGFETAANRVVQFGLSSLFAVGNTNSLSTTNWFGSPSYTLVKRGVAMDHTAEDWVADYDDENKDYRADADVFLKLNFTRKLSLTVRAGIDFQNTGRYFWYGSRTSFGKDFNGAASQISTFVLSYNAGATLRYSTFIGKDNKLDASLGAETLGDITKFNTMNGNDFFDHSLRARGINLAQSKDNIHSYNHFYTHHALFATLDYSFRDIFGVNGVYRPDFSPKYYDARPVNYWAANVRVSLRDLLLKDSNAVSTLRLKGGYGVSGREIYVPYDLLGNYTTGSYTAVEEGAEIYYDGLNAVRSSEYNVSVDFGFFGDRLSGSFGYYDKTTRDLLALYCFGKKTGRYWDWSSRSFDSGIESTLGNRGFELTLGGDIIRRRDLNWRLSLNGAYNVNQMLSVADADLYGHEVGSGLRTNVNAVGRQAGSIFGFETDGSGNPVDQTADGVVDDADYIVLGNPIPQFTGGLNTGLTAGRWSAELGFDGAAGFELVNLNRFVQSPKIGTAITDEFVEKGDFLRLNRLGVAYTFPFKAEKGLKSLSLSLTGTNLFVLSGYSGWNPDVNSFSSCGLSRGLDYGAARTARSFILGVCLKF